jgi:hypothetical protein
MKEGYLVTIIFGGTTPYLLRKVGSYYKLFGERYVHCMMNGEALADAKKKTCLKDQSYEIY